MVFDEESGSANCNLLRMCILNRVEVRCFVSLCWLCAFISTVSLAESRLNFPRLSNEPGTITGVAIVNPRDEAATITVTAYLENGALLAGEGIQNPVEMVIEGNQQLALLTSDFFGSALPEPTVGWFSVVSETNDLTGFFMFLDLEVTVFDGADLPREAPAILLPDVRVGGGFSTEINIVNPSDVDAEIDLELSGEAGESVSRQLALPPHGVQRLDVGELFALGESADIRFFYITASADTDIACFELVKGPGDLMGLNAVPIDEPVSRMFFPQMAVLGGLESRLTLSSGLEEAVIVTIKAHKPDGTLYDQENLQTNPVNRVIQPLGLLSQDLEAMFGFAGEATLEGWLEIEASSEALFGTLSYSVPVVGSVASVSGAAQGLTRVLFSHIATDLGFFTGLAFLNSGALTANVRVVAFRPDGARIGSFSTVLRPGERLSRLIEDLIPAAAGQAGGFIWVKSDVPVYLTSIFGSLASGVFSNIPPQIAPTLFEPDSDGEEILLRPPLAILEPGAQQSFEVEGLVGPLEWSVNGATGGDATVGRINGVGTYTAPALIPEDQPVTVAANSEADAVGASVDVLSPEAFRSDLGILQSIAYLGGLQKLFTAELVATAAPADSSGPLQTAFSTRIVDATEEVSQTLVTIPDEVSKMIPFTGEDDQEYMLMSAPNTGRVLRLDPVTGAFATVVEGLNQPTALALDVINGDLLVAEETEVSSIPLASLNVGLAGSVSLTGQALPVKKKVFDLPRGRIAVNECNGNIYVALPARGEIVEFVRFTGSLRTIAQDLANPGQLLGFYRDRMGCPNSFHLLVPERGAARIQLAIPAIGEIRPWLDASGVVDIIFLAEGNPFAPGGGVMLAHEDGGLSLVRLPRVYALRGLNPPRKLFPGPCRIRQLTVTESGQNHSPVLAENGNHVFFTSTSDPLGLNQDENKELFDFDLVARTLIQLTDTIDSEVFQPASDFDGSLVAFASTANLTGDAPQGANLFLLSSSLFSRAPGTPHPGERYELNHAGTRLVYVSSADITGENEDGNPEVFLFDSDQNSRQISQTGKGFNGQVAISGDGKRVAFHSTADISGLNPGGDEVVYLHELETGTTTLIAVVREAPGDLIRESLHLDFDASHIVFASREDLTGQNPRGDKVLFLFDRTEQTVEQVTEQLGTSDVADLSADGRVLLMASNKNPVKLNRDTNREVFLVDFLAGKTFQVTRSREVSNQAPSLTAGGRLLAFRSNADFQGQNPDGNFEIYLADCSAVVD